MKLRSTQPENSAQITFSEFIKSNKPKESKPIEFKQPKLNKYNFNTQDLEDYYNKTYGDPELEPIHLNVNLEIKGDNANCTGPQDRVVHSVALEECGGHMLNVFNTPNIVEVHSDFSKAKKLNLSKSSQKIILNNSIKA